MTVGQPRSAMICCTCCCIATRTVSYRSRWPPRVQRYGRFRFSAAIRSPPSFAPPQQERFDTPRASSSRRAASPSFRFGAPAAGEIRLPPRKPGSREIELRPQFAQMIFQRRAGQGIVPMAPCSLRTVAAILLAAFFTVCASSRIRQWYWYLRNSRLRRARSAGRWSDQSCAPICPNSALRPARCKSSTRSAGVNFAASLLQL